MSARTRTRTRTACEQSAMAEARHVWRDDPTAGTMAGSFTLDAEIARARRDMGAARWQQLQDEWNAK
jgi:hypothetical protein